MTPPATCPTCGHLLGMPVSEAARELGVSRQRVHRMMATGQLRSAGWEPGPGRGRMYVERASVEERKRTIDTVSASE
ncbi:MAG: helix-turn-helix domain-containing protein [Actinomycetota bacterium]